MKKHFAIFLINAAFALPVSLGAFWICTPLIEGFSPGYQVPTARQWLEPSLFPLLLMVGPIAGGVMGYALYRVINVLCFPRHKALFFVKSAGLGIALGAAYGLLLVVLYTAMGIGTIRFQGSLWTVLLAIVGIVVAIGLSSAVAFWQYWPGLLVGGIWYGVMNGFLVRQGGLVTKDNSP